MFNKSLFSVPYKLKPLLAQVSFSSWFVDSKAFFKIIFQLAGL